MIAGLFLSRAVLSVSMILFGLNGLWGVHPGEWVRQRWWCWGAAWVGCFALSYFWSANIPYWGEHVQVKLPVLLLPLAFAFLPKFCVRQMQWYTLALNAALCVGVGYSLSFIFQNPSFYISGYDYAHLLPTIPENDHIVFSIMLALGVVWNIYIFPHSKRWMKWLLAASAVIYSIMLHVLAARTGLVAWYLFLLGYVLYLVFRKGTRVWGLILIGVVLIGVPIAIKQVPTLEKRIGHIYVTLHAYREGDKTGNYSDIGRYLSYDIAIGLIGAHPWLGTGAGDMMDEMKAAYAERYPEVQEAQMLLPHNEFLITGIAAGIPAMIIFIVWLVYPLITLRRNRNGFFFFIVWCMLLIPLFVDPFLEIQFGVFVYLLFLLMQRHVMLCPIAGPGNE